jgi:hypothetical protein
MRNFQLFLKPVKQSTHFLSDDYWFLEELKCLTKKQKS